jgi:alkylation response protein AidB-like acyl-CoA dehydrogenase
MDFKDTAQEHAFRMQARCWLETNAPGKGSAGDFSDAYQSSAFDEAQYVRRCKDWQATLSAGGWAGITWPKEYGGCGGTSLEASIFAEEQSRSGVSSGIFAIGIGMAGPTIAAHGTDAQKERYLPRLLRGEEVWCQLFSEPSAGSDLASLATRAEVDGDEWVVNGQKVWTSGAHYSDFGILLTRTDLDVPKHRGITYFLVDMRTPGIDIRPLRQMTGTSHFSEVFLTDVRIPKENILGEVNEGWGVAMTTLTNERMLIGEGASKLEYSDVRALVGDRIADPILRQRLADAFIRFEILRYLSMRVRTAASQGKMPGPEVSVMKLFYAGHLKKTSDLALALQGPAGMLAGADAPAAGAWQQQFLNAPAMRIAGGSDEIQRKIIGERVLGLPSEPRVDKDVPFRDQIHRRP